MTIHIKPREPYIQCKWCNQYSYVHPENGPPTQVHPGTENYGHIHLSQVSQQKAAAFSIALGLFVPVIILGIVVAVIAVVVFIFGVGVFAISRPLSPAPAPRAVVASSGSRTAQSCNQVVACCKKIAGTVPNQPAQERVCDGLLDLQKEACLEQYKEFLGAAESLGLTCE
jgi:hypothetical protein